MPIERSCPFLARISFLTPPTRIDILLIVKLVFILVIVFCVVILLVRLGQALPGLLRERPDDLVRDNKEVHAHQLELFAERHESGVEGRLGLGQRENLAVMEVCVGEDAR
jgi:hypothetical protein